MVMLARFVPWGVRDVEFEVRAPSRGTPIGRGALLARAVGGGLVALAFGLGGVGLVGGLSALRAHKGFAAVPAVATVLHPARVADWTTAVGLVVLAVLAGLATAAAIVARRGVAGGPAGSHGE